MALFFTKKHQAFNLTRIPALPAFACAALAICNPAHAGTFQVVHNFAGAPSDGSYENYSSLIQSGSTLYGLTANGGAHNSGTIIAYNINSGMENLAYSFGSSPNDGNGPAGPLTLSGSTLYGITPQGGTSGGGTLYAFNTTTNTENVLHAFGGPGDAAGISGAINYSGSMLYGDAQSGGAYGSGAIFSYNLNTNSENVLYSFHGGIPISVTLSGSVLYGLTALGGSNEDGSIFSYNLNTNTETNLFSFNGSDGSVPEGNLVVSGATLYGVTRGGVFSYNTLTNTLTDYSISDGGSTAGYIMLSGSIIYGMTTNGGANGTGAVFSLNVNSDNFTNLHSFNLSTDGGDPTGNILLDGSTLYGMTPKGGAHSDGTIFSLTIPEPTPLCLLALGSIPLLLRNRKNSIASVSSA